MIQAYTMPTKNIAPNAYPVSLSAMKPLKTFRRQRGVTLIELMVGLVIGLMVVAAAMAALMVSRSIFVDWQDSKNNIVELFRPQHFLILLDEVSLDFS